MLPALYLSAVLAAQTSAPVHVNDYSGHYGRGLNPREQQFNAGIVGAYHAKEEAVGNLEGAWQLSDTAGKGLMRFELRAPKTHGGDIEGAWRSLIETLGIGRSGFVSSLTLSGNDLEINYIVGHAHSPNVLHLHRTDAATWTGTLMQVSGARVPVVLQRVRAIGG